MTHLEREREREREREGGGKVKKLKIKKLLTSLVSYKDKKYREKVIFLI